MECSAVEATGLGFVCFVVINPGVLSANRVDFGLFLFHKFSNLPHPQQLREARRHHNMCLEHISEFWTRVARPNLDLSSLPPITADVGVRDYRMFLEGFSGLLVFFGCFQPSCVAFQHSCFYLFSKFITPPPTLHILIDHPHVPH